MYVLKYKMELRVDFVFPPSVGRWYAIKINKVETFT